ncbi:hypothetical protein PTKIN_Ptkin06aG0152600 [Pterospermum kingtungense]
MAAYRSLVIFALVLAIVPSTSYATEFIVGGEVFQYTAPNHNVYKVNGTDFQSCNVPSNNSLGSFTGNDTIKLATAGNKWYICGVSRHCDKGMKLKITVLESGPAPAPSAASA